MDGQWMLVETLGGDEPTVVAVGDRSRDMRRIGNMFRRGAKPALDRLIAECVAAREPVARPIPKSAVEQLGPFGLAVPTRGLSGDVAAVQIWCGPADVEPDPPEPLGVWEWELGLTDRPARLQMSEDALDLIGMDPKFRDRTVFGPADYFTRIERMSELLELDAIVKHAQPGEESHGTAIVRPDGGKPLRRLHYAQRCVSTPAGPRLRGIARDITHHDDPAKMRVDLAETTLVQALASFQKMYAAIVDITHPTAPYVLKWLTPHPPGVGHGVSTGQAPGIHPDDLPKVLGWINEIHLRRGTISGRARTRAGGGGWMAGSFVGHLLDPTISKDIVVGIVAPDSIAIEGADDTAR